MVYHGKVLLWLLALVRDEIVYSVDKKINAERSFRAAIYV